MYLHQIAHPNSMVPGTLPGLMARSARVIFGEANDLLVYPEALILLDLARWRIVLNGQLPF